MIGLNGPFSEVFHENPGTSKYKRVVACGPEGKLVEQSDWLWTRVN